MATDVIVIGAGIVGAACAYELSRQGGQVLVILNPAVTRSSRCGQAFAMALLLPALGEAK